MQVITFVRINYLRLSSTSSVEAKPSQKGLKKTVSTDSPSKKGPKKSLSQDSSAGATDARPTHTFEKKKPLTKTERRELQVSREDTTNCFMSSLFVKFVFKLLL